jgi:Tfp pilus assembly protein PilF
LNKSRDLEDSLAVQLALGKASALSGQAAEAAAAWQRALEHDVGNAEARNGLAELALGGGNAKQALAWLEPLADHPHLSSTTAYVLERVYTLLGNEDELERWQGKTAELRQREKREAAFRRRLGVGL